MTNGLLLWIEYIQCNINFRFLLSGSNKILVKQLSRNIFFEIVAFRNITQLNTWPVISYSATKKVLVLKATILFVRMINRVSFVGVMQLFVTFLFNKSCYCDIVL